MSEQSTATATPQVQGIDVSHLQQTVDWIQVQQAGKLFTFIKATDGITWTDPLFATNWSGAKAAGLLLVPARALGTGRVLRSLPEKIDPWQSSSGCKRS